MLTIKCAGQWYQVYSYCHATITTVQLQKSLHLQNLSSVPIKQNPPPSPPPALW